MPARNRRDQHHLIAILERVRIAAQKTNVLIVHIDIDEPPQLPILVLHIRRERGKLYIEFRQQTWQVCRIRLKRFQAIRMPRERGRQSHLDAHRAPPASSNSSSSTQPSKARMYASNAASFGFTGTDSSNRPSSASVVFKPFPVMQTTVVSSEEIRPCAYSRAVTAVVTPPAVSVKMPSVSASSCIPATISTSETSSAQPPDSRIIFAAAGPSEGFPIASERAIVFGFCGSM